MPDGTARKAVYHVDAQAAGGCGRGHEFGGRPLAHAFGIAISPNVVGENGLMAVVDVVTDGLAYQVGGDGEQLQLVFLQRLALRLAVGVVGLGDLEVVSPAGEFEAIVAKGPSFLAQRVDVEIGPLAGEQGYRSRHGKVSSL